MNNKVNKYFNLPLPQCGFSGSMKPNDETNNANEHNMVKNANWREAESSLRTTKRQLAIYKHDRGVELGSSEKQF